MFCSVCQREFARPPNLELRPYVTLTFWLPDLRSRFIPLPREPLVAIFSKIGFIRFGSIAFTCLVTDRLRTDGRTNGRTGRKQYASWQSRLAKEYEKLSYRKQTARQLRTQYAEGIYSNSVTLKWRSCRGHHDGRCKRHHLIDHTQLIVLVELFDVKYYRDLEIWVRGHWRSFQLVPFEILGAVSIRLLYSMALSIIVCEI